MLADTDEWGQIYILTLLTRYARTQFANPNADHPVRAKKSTKFYSDDESGSSDDDATTVVEPGEIDPDHLLLLRAALPLLQSRNTGVRTRTASRLALHSLCYYSLLLVGCARSGYSVLLLRPRGRGCQGWQVACTNCAKPPRDPIRCTFQHCHDG